MFSTATTATTTSNETNNINFHLHLQFLNRAHHITASTPSKYNMMSDNDSNNCRRTTGSSEQQGNLVSAATANHATITSEDRKRSAVEQPDVYNPKKQKSSSEEKTGKADTAAAAVLQEGDAPPCIPLFESANMRFPDQLWELLQYSDKELKDAIWWLPGSNDDVFCINELVFSEKLLESHFRGNKFSSIIRKLNRWGFRKHVDRSLPAKTVAYYHRSFQKGRPELVKCIEKEESKVEEYKSAADGTGSGNQQYTLFPQATMSQGILARALQENQAAQAAAAASRGAAAGVGPMSIHSPIPGPSSAAFASPFSQRSQSNILQSIFGRRSAGGLLSTPSSSFLTSPLPTPGGANNRLSTLAAGATSPHSDFLSQSNTLQLPLQRVQHSGTAAAAAAAGQVGTTEQNALLASMVSNIERERQRREQREREGHLLLALERERLNRQQQQRLEEQKQDPDDATAGSLFSLMSATHGQAFLQQQSQQQQQQQQQHGGQQQGADAATLASEQRRREMHARLAAIQQQQHQRQQQSVVSSPFPSRTQLQASTLLSPNNNFLMSPLLSTPLTGHRVLGQDSLSSIPGELLLTPHQRRVQLEQLQQQQRQRLEEELQRNTQS